MAEDSRDLGPESLRALVEQASGALKVFPLSGVVILPGTPTPLHVFEPRYRAMTADALATDRVMAVATLRSAEGAREERAALHAVAGAGFIEVKERLPQGRFNIVLRGAARLADLVAAAVVSEPRARLHVLEELDVAKRLDFVMSEVAGVILVLSQGRSPRV
jgi:uncharacterized protein